MAPPTPLDFYDVAMALGGVRAANQALRTVCHEFVPRSLLMQLRRCELLLEAEERYQFGDENEPGVRLHITEPFDYGELPATGEVAYCGEYVTTASGLWARKPSLSSCPACLLAYWNAEGAD